MPIAAALAVHTEEHNARAMTVSQTCVRCVMDTTDPDIRFDSAGVCHHCTEFDRLATYHQGRRDLNGLVATIQADGKGNEYDCVIGVSGGVDSTYLAYLVRRELGLRPLAVHVDNGWNSNLAVSNIEKTLDVLGIDLHTEVLDWAEFRDLQLAFLRASTPDSEIPTDHAIAAVLTRLANAHGIKHILGGSNSATEAIMPLAWSQGIRDWKYIRSVHARFGTRPLSTFPHLTLAATIYFERVRRIRFAYPLNMIDYRKAEAIEILRSELSWEPYGGKHHESVYTRFFQSYILPTKFGVDKRRAHLSTLICNGELTRQHALAELATPPMSPAAIAEDKAFVAKKLGLTIVEFDEIMALPPKTFHEYPTYEGTPVLGAALRARRNYRRQRRLDASATAGSVRA